MKRVPGILRVTGKTSTNDVFVVSNPEVYKTSDSQAHLIFGETQFERAQASAAKQVTTAKFDDGQVYEADLENKDIELVASQAGVPRAKAVDALKQQKGDIVQALVQLLP